MSAAALRANILDSQRHGQPYREFTRRGPRRTGHRGRTGDQHTEWFWCMIQTYAHEKCRNCKTARLVKRPVMAFASLACK